MEDLIKMYEAAAEYYDIYSAEWAEMLTQFSTFVFCKENRKLIISEYLFWEDLTKRLKEYHIPYSHEIDLFLNEYNCAINKCLNFN